MICTGRTAILIEDGACNTSSYVLAFEDQFDGNKLDTDVWNTAIGVTRDTGYHSSKQWYDTKNIRLSDGTLKLIVEKTTLLDTCYQIWTKSGVHKLCSDFHYSAGEIYTKKEFGHGVFEIRCRLMKGRGLRMAFWTYTIENENEIDVFEVQDEKNIWGNHDRNELSRVIHMNSRTDFENDGILEDCSSESKQDDLSDQFHTYTLVWTPFKIQWFLDGKLLRTSSLFYDMQGRPLDCNITRGTQVVINRAFPKHPMIIVLSTAAGIKPFSPDHTTALPAEMEIDYVRYYELSN